MNRTFFLGLVFIISLFFSISASAKTRIDGTAKKGGKDVKTSATITYELMETFPSCTVTVYKAGTLNLATIYSDNAGTLKSNPFTASSDASYFFYVDNGKYDVKFSGTGISSPFTEPDKIALDPNDLFVDTSNYGVKGNCIADDTVAFQAAIDAAPNGSTIFFPKGFCLNLSATIKVYGRKGLVFKFTDVEDGYNHDTTTLKWVGAVNGLMFNVINSGSCVFKGGKFLSDVVGTAGMNWDYSSDTVTYGTGTSTSNISIGNFFNFTKATTNTYGIRIAFTENQNNERMQIYRTVCAFSPNVGPNDKTNLTRGTCFKSGDVAGNTGFNVLNLVIEMSYWFGCTYGVDAANAGTVSFKRNQSNFSTLDYKIQGFSQSTTIIEGHRTESARQFVDFNSGTLILEGNEIGAGDFDDTGVIPIIKMTLGKLKTTGNFIVGVGVPAGVKVFGGGGSAQLTSEGDTWVGNIGGPAEQVDVTIFTLGAKVEVPGSSGTFIVYNGVVPNTYSVIKVWNPVSNAFGSVLATNSAGNIVTFGTGFTSLAFGTQYDAPTGFGFGRALVANEFNLGSSIMRHGGGTGSDYIFQRNGGTGFYELDGDQAGFRGFYFKQSVGINVAPVADANPRLKISGNAQMDALQLNTTLFASLPADSNGTIRYCSDCAKASPCVGAGTGAFAKRLNGAWDCD